MKRELLLALLLLMFAALLNAQPVPDQIDIYSYDPSTKTVADTKEYAVKANEAYGKAEYETAAKYYMAYLSSNPDNASSWYNLSCCFGLLGKPELAAKYLQVAYKAGFRDLGHIKADTDFNPVKQDQVFKTAMDSLQTWTDKRAYYQGKMEYIPVGQLQAYRLHVPKDYNPAKSYTLIIGLHGYGDRAENFAALWRYLDKEDIIFAVPEAPYAFPDEEKPQYSWDPFIPRESAASKQALDLNTKYIVDLAKRIKQGYNIDQTWLFGFSQGAYLSYIFALKNSRYFDGFVACGGGLITDLISSKDYKSAKKLKVIISHGTQDKVVAYTEGETAYKVLKDKGIDVIMHSFDGPHVVSKEVFPVLFEALK
jgi:predicted esterase